DRLRDAFKEQGVQLLIDRDAQARLNNRRLMTNYILCVENLTPAELAAVFAQLGREDRDGLFEYLMIAPMTGAQHRELSQWLGASAMAMPKSPLGVDITKPLSDTTLDVVSDTLEGRGVRRPGAGAAGKSSDRIALVLPHNVLRSKATPELKQYL